MELLSSLPRHDESLMAGWLALVGGAEFQRGCDEADRMLIDAAGGVGARVAIVPTAAAAEGAPRMAAANGVRHFNRLGAQAEGVMIVDAATANDESLAAQLAAARLIYITGGDPGYLLRSLSGSLAWRTMLDAWRSGAVLAGSSAGAMVLCDAMWTLRASASRVEPGLGVVRPAAVIPHHRVGSEWVERLRDALGNDYSIFGIAEQTALIWDSAGWRVAGPGGVTIYARGQIEIHHPSMIGFQISNVSLELMPG
jgi:cyanophycinase